MSTRLSVEDGSWRAPVPVRRLPRASAQVREGVRRALALGPALLLFAVVALPLVAVFGFLLAPATGIWAHLAATLLGEYLRNTLVLCLGVATLTAAIGTGAAWLVTMHRFPGRAVLEWALVLPLAMPTYVLAYAYTDFLQVTGPVQTLLRELTGWGWRDYWFPEIRSLGGAVFVLSAALYPYVYVTARAAFVEQAVCALEVSRTLGCGHFRSFWRVGLPMARPAIAAGMAFVLMETLADFGAVSYFEVRTFTTGIYRAWYAMGSPEAAAQLASVLLLFVLAVVLLERRSRGQARVSSPTPRAAPTEPLRLGGPPGLAAALLCLLPILAGFLLPGLLLVVMARGAGDGLLPGELWVLVRNTLLLAGFASLLVVAAAIGAVYAARPERGPLARGLVRLATLGYAAPGVVIAVGLLVAIGWLDRLLAGTQHLIGLTPGLVIAGSLGALFYGYLVRFLAVAFNPLEAGLARVRSQVGDAARTLGCSPRGVLGRVHLPLLRTSLLSALLLVFVEVMKELPATMILRPFNFDTLAVEAYQLATTERLDGAALPSLLIVAAGLVPVILLCRLLARGRRGARQPADQ
jgi:iron(III) transport system permease protein